MSQAPGATVTTEFRSDSTNLIPTSLSHADGESLPDRWPGRGLNDAWMAIVQGLTDSARPSDGAVSQGQTITVDLAHGESVQEFSTRLRMLLLFMNREKESVSATVSPSFQNDTYPAMLALVSGFHRSGASDEWRPNGPRSIRVGKARHLFVSVDMPVDDRSPSPDTLLEVVSAHRIDASWYDRRVRPRTSSPGLITVMFGVDDQSSSAIAGSTPTNSIFKQERAKNLSGRHGGIHFSRQSDWTVTTAV